MNTPWGKAERIRHIDTGILMVYVGQYHGGIMLAEARAARDLSEPAQSRARRYGCYYCYEWGYEWAIAAFELSRYWPALFANCEMPVVRRSLLRVLSAWAPDYLWRVGHDPDPNGVRVWKTLEYWSWHDPEGVRPALDIEKT